MPIESQRNLNHPTRLLLVNTVIDLLKTTPVTQIRSEEVLLVSNVTKGSLYHHFADFEDLLSTALVSLFTTRVATLVGDLTEHLRTADSRESASELLRDMLRRQSMINIPLTRVQRMALAIFTATKAEADPLLAKFQSWTTDLWREIFDMCASRGWADPAMDSRNVAIMVQGILVSRIFDDISDHAVDPDRWLEDVFRVIDPIFFGFQTIGT